MSPTAQISTAGMLADPGAMRERVTPRGRGRSGRSLKRPGGGNRRSIGDSKPCRRRPLSSGLSTSPWPPRTERARAARARARECSGERAPGPRATGTPFGAFSSTPCTTHRGYGMEGKQVRQDTTICASVQGRGSVLRVHVNLTSEVIPALSKLPTVGGL